MKLNKALRRVRLETREVNLYSDAVVHLDTRTGTPGIMVATPDSATKEAVFARAQKVLERFFLRVHRQDEKNIAANRVFAYFIILDDGAADG